MQKAGQPMNPQIKDMQEAVISQGKEGAEFKARKNSASHVLEKTDQLYQRKDPSKIKMDEFCLELDFKYGVPVMIMDVIQAFTGYNHFHEIDREVSPPRLIERMNPDDENFINYKQDNLTDEQQDVVWLVFNTLGELDLKTESYK